jgi:hypothetical protein
MTSTSKGSGEEVNGNREIKTNSKEAAAEKGETENTTNSGNDENEKNTSLSQQSTQEYVPKETERHTTETEEGKHIESEMDKTKNIEISCAFQEGGKNKPESNSDQTAHHLHITNNKDNTPLNIRVITDRNNFSTSFIEHSEEKPDRCFMSTKHIQNNGNQTATSADMGTEQDMEVNGLEGSKLNIISKCDKFVSASGKNVLVPMNISSHNEKEQQTKPSYDSVITQIQSLTVKSPQYVHSIRTLTGSENDSPLPAELILNHSQLTWNITGEKEQLTEVQTMSQTTSIKITEQKIGDNHCEEKGCLSGEILTPQAETEENNHSPLVTRQVLQTVGNFCDKSQNKYKESTYVPSLLTDILIDKSDIHLDKMTQDLTLSTLVAAKPSEICTTESTKLQGGTEQADRETVIPMCTVENTRLKASTEQADRKTATAVCTVDSTGLKAGTEQVDTDTAVPMCTVKSTRLKGGTEQTDTETAKPVSLLDPDPNPNIQAESTKMATNTRNTKAQNAQFASATTEDIQKIQDLLVSPATGENKCTEEHLIRKYDTASNTVSYSTETTKVETVQPGSDHNKSNENSTTYPMKNMREGMTDDVKVGNKGPLNIANLSPMKKECFPKEHEINQLNIGFAKSSDTFSKFPTSLETSNTRSCPTASTNIIDLPEIANHSINENCSTQPAKNTRSIKDGVNIQNTEPLYTLHPSASTKKEFLPKQDEINQSKTDFRNPNDIFHELPTAMETSNTASCSTVAPSNEIYHPRKDLNQHNKDKCSKQPVKNADGNNSDVNTENMEPLRTVHPCTPTRKEFLLKQDEINRSTAGFDNSKNVLCRSPIAAVEAPSILRQSGEHSLTNEHIPDTTSHGYLLDDDIGLTGSQLLRIEDQCQHNIQSTEEEWNHPSSCGEARVPEIDRPSIPKWGQCVQQKRQKLRSIIGDISRLK